jgi:hypothetical protein
MDDDEDVIREEDEPVRRPVGRRQQVRSPPYAGGRLRAPAARVIISVVHQSGASRRLRAHMERRRCVGGVMGGGSVTNGGGAPRRAVRRGIAHRRAVCRVISPTGPGWFRLGHRRLGVPGQQLGALATRWECSVARRSPPAARHTGGAVCVVAPGPLLLLLRLSWLVGCAW